MQFMTSTFTRFVLAGALAVSSVALAQQAPDNQQTFNQPQDPQFSEQDQQSPPPGPQGGWNRFPDRGPQGNGNGYPGGFQNGNQRDEQRSYGPVPAQLNLRAGTFITVRIDQGLSSDRNHEGDYFNATLVRPLVVDGVVVAEPGQTIAGRVAEAQKAGRVQGLSRLAVQLTDLTLVDGQQLPIRSQLIGRTAPTSVGRDVGAIAGTTALGAAIGSGVDWGRGAAIGAASGAAAGIVGVLLTRGHPSIIYPESVLTFRIETPLVIATDRSPNAFHFIEPGEYQDSYRAQTPAPRPRYAYATPYPVYRPYPYSYGPTLGIWFGGGRGYYGGRYGGRYRR
jgi:hypothetical protein